MIDASTEYRPSQLRSAPVVSSQEAERSKITSKAPSMVGSASRYVGRSTKPRESDKVAYSEGCSRLVLWGDVPHWQQDNHHIHGSYRRVSGSYWGSLASLCYIHNETVNIYTHLIPALLALPSAFLLYKILHPRYTAASVGEIIAIGCFFLSAAACLGMSAAYHTISNHSPRVNKIGNQLDYVGIVLLIAGSFVPSIYYGFWCDIRLRNAYWTMICTLGVGCIAVSVMSKFRTPGWRPFRAGMFVSMGLSAVFPILHGLQLDGIQQMRKQVGLAWLVLQGVLYVLGAFIYAAQVPEKWFPGRHDVWGSSHQIFHVLVVLAATSHLIGLLGAFDHRHGFESGPCT